ncbi:histidine kinase [Nostoc linckia z18]|uniref:Histidine kinase n=2 Tax=Nostoc linckia TaxID=92942 RepID=A0A9Q6ELV6_NOSLI|nr:CHASE2 domain-containing protein [Nostoc linckia]PHK34276.1 histidine kinase [Nostoc linckia z15]PHK46849.1 histidine kinase [Nostoc linckia z16]PHJ61283.1 histidine kinase [Nostoc linckia z1]PHJ68048.1 histidine kinase [Nostoc linckia z3]PHJ74375.1 histidine kinase [Nostoc linckia z2]
MVRRIWRIINSKNQVWRVGLLPGISAIAFVIALRLVGSLQFLELAAYDTLMRLRPQEKIDERILIVGINEKDINRVKSYPIPDRDLALLLNKLKTYKPAVIGLDIIRDLPQEPGHTELVTTLAETKNLIAVEKVLPDLSGFTFNPPRTLTPEQVGFSDALIDGDGKQRRSLLATSNSNGEWKLSFSLRLAQIYLKTKNIALDNVDEDPYSMRFGVTKLPRFQPNSGGYIQTDAGGSQILINFRNCRKPFHTVSLTEIQSGKVNPDWIRGKIVLIAMTSPSAKDYVNSSAINSENPALNYGVEIQAHVVSQLVSAVLDNRPMINVWGDGWEYLWIISWGILGLSLGRGIRNPLKILLYIIIANICLFFICYGLIIIGWWIPIVPACLILVFNGIGLAAFYRYDEALRDRIQYRQLIIDQVFDTIHSHPLQTLNIILREVQSDEGLSNQELVSQLQQLNQELRDVYDLVRKEAATELNNFYSPQEQRLDLSQPLDEILFEVYNDILERDYSFFKNIKQKIFKFEPMDECNLSIEQKRSLCRFLEEALRNVKKYADGTNRLEIICSQEDGKNVIRVADNGLKIETMADLSSHSGFGTKLAKNLAKQLRGEFKRYPNTPRGIVCQLTWSARKLWFWRF